MRGLFLFAFLFFVSCSGQESEESSSSEESTTLCDNSSLTTHTYLMTFHACVSDCSDPSNHTIYLAGSDDGTSWQLISEFEPRFGSVPDLIFFNDFLYLFHVDGSESWVKLNACFEVVEEGDASLASDTDSFGFVDPSLLVSGDDLLLFYLPGIMGQNPASCSTYPCEKEIHSAIADNASLVSFTQVDGNRAAITITSGTFSDPDIVTRSDGTYLLYVSSGQSTYVYSSDQLDETFTSPDGSQARAISANSGGVPSAIEAPDGNIWLYVTTSRSGMETIRRAVSNDGLTSLLETDFSTVVDATISSDFSAETNVSSPSIIAWPPESWSREQGE